MAAYLVGRWENLMVDLMDVEKVVDLEGKMVDEKAALMVACSDGWKVDKTGMHLEHRWVACSVELSDKGRALQRAENLDF